MANQTQAAAAQQAPKPLPFRVGTQPTTLQDVVYPAVTLGASTQPLTVYNPTPNSFLSGLWIEVTGTATGNSASVAFNADGPFNTLQTVLFSDTNQKPIVGPINGYDLYLVNCYGGYFGINDPKASYTYSVTTGSGSSGGSFHFFLYLPLEVDCRDALGSLENKSTQSSYHLNLTLNTVSAVYSTAPTAAPSVTVSVSEDGYLQPIGSDASGAPYSTAPSQLGTTQFWVKGNYVLSAGNNVPQIQQGLGYGIRNYVFECYDNATGTRAAGEADWPSPIQFYYKGTLVKNWSKTLWAEHMSRVFGFTSSTPDAALAKQNGVYVLEFTRDNIQEHTRRSA